MGKFILCSGKRAENPFLIHDAGINIYTIEELCYYLYHNIYLLDSGMFSSDFIKWLEQEIQMKDLSMKMKDCIKSKASFKDFVVIVLCSTDYYEEQEIKELIKIMNKIEGLPFVKRRKLRADQYFDNGQYMFAAKEYNEILESNDASVFSSKEYGNVLHNFAVTLLYVGSFSEALVRFEEAYKLNQNPETLKQYLLLLRMMYSEQAILKKLDMMNISKDFAMEVFSMYHTWKQEVYQQSDYELYKTLKMYKKNKDITALLQETEGILQKWTHDYRTKIC